MQIDAEMMEYQNDGNSQLRGHRASSAGDLEQMHQEMNHSFEDNTNTYAQENAMHQGQQMSLHQEQDTTEQVSQFEIEAHEERIDA